MKKANSTEQCCQRKGLCFFLLINNGLLLALILQNARLYVFTAHHAEIRRIQQHLGITAVYVTHDQSEAMAISDNIILMKKGVIAQMGSPTDIYYHPNSEFVADFIGECNFLKGSVSAVRGGEADVKVNGVDLTVVTDKAMMVGDEGEIVLRPEAIVLDDRGMLPCKVELSCFMGSYQNYHVRVGDTLVKITDNCPINKKVFEVGDTACISFDKRCAHLL